MILMGMTAEVARAREHVKKLTFDNDHDASFFETSIRWAPRRGSLSIGG